MSPNQERDQNHHHQESATPLSFEEKMSKLLNHWIRHNDDHADNYRQWARQAEENGHPEVAALLEEAARMTVEISGRFEAAAKMIA
jgi:hypothetical protein